MVKCPLWLPCPVTLLHAACLLSLSLSWLAVQYPWRYTWLSAWRFNTLGGVSGVLPPPVCLYPGLLLVHFVQIAECFPACWYNRYRCYTWRCYIHDTHGTLPVSIPPGWYTVPPARILHQFSHTVDSTHGTLHGTHITTWITWCTCSI